jgi:hypothetical protein
VGLLRRLFGRDDRNEVADHAAAERFDPATADEEERAHELELARFDQERIDDLIRRQQRYADRSWTPAAQGGERRADDADAPER